MIEDFIQNAVQYDHYYLVDPTFIQYLDDTNPKSPINWLNQRPAGQILADTLVEDGSIELTPEIAELYLRSLCGGKKLLSNPQKYMAFLINPPTYEPHFNPDQAHTLR